MFFNSSYELIKSTGHSVVPLVLQLDLDGVWDWLWAKQLAKADGTTNTGQSRAAVRAKCSVTKYARHIGELLRASISRVAESCKQCVAEVAAVSRLHLHNGLVILEEHTHCVVICLIGLG